MAINKNFVVKNGLEVNTNQIFADSTSGKVGIGSTLPTVELDVTGAIAATDVTSSLLRVTGYSTLPQVTVTDNMVISGITTGNHLNVLGISSLSNTRVVGVTTFENNVNLDGNVNVTGFSTFVGLTSVVGNLRVSGFTTFSNQIIIEDNSDVFVTGVVTATRFDGAFTGTGINIGIQSEGTTVSTATSIINFVPVNASVTVESSDGGAAISTVTFQSSGISLGLAIALGA
tara:strand:+ start:2468 stop:3157 length:690 start_codon:yes stop_codon:yes gene_type:complete